MFVDRVTVQCIAGKGGNGIVAWRREKFIPKGGPSGGNGGHGGSIFLQASTHTFSLDALKYQHLLKAKDGQQGGGACKTGRNGPDLTIDVPCGTVVRDIQTGEMVADLTEKGERFLLCQGGKGGKGNFHFRSPSHRAPHESTPGTMGESREVELELKLIADVGLLGMPNAGKSTLMNQLARLRVKVGAYPFTTLHPNIGFFTAPSGERIYLADVPGIIEGASRNRGLGHAFLKHIERTRLLLVILDVVGTDGIPCEKAFEILLQELGSYDAALLKMPRLVILNKMDQEEAQQPAQAFIQKYEHTETILPLAALYPETLTSLHDALIAHFLVEKTDTLLEETLLRRDYFSENLDFPE